MMFNLKKNFFDLILYKKFEYKKSIPSQSIQEKYTSNHWLFWKQYFKSHQVISFDADYKIQILYPFGLMQCW